MKISRNTVYKYLQKTPDEMAEWTAATLVRTKKLDIHKELILDWLRKHSDMTAAQIYDWLKEKFPYFQSGRKYSKELSTRYSGRVFNP